MCTGRHPSSAKHLTLSVKCALGHPKKRPDTQRYAANKEHTSAPTFSGDTIPCTYRKAVVMCESHGGGSASRCTKNQERQSDKQADSAHDRASTLPHLQLKPSLGGTLHRFPAYAHSPSVTSAISAPLQPHVTAIHQSPWSVCPPNHSPEP